MSSTSARTISEVMRPGALTAMPSASVSPRIGKLLSLDQIVHRRIERGLHADDLDAGLQRLGGDRDAGDQAAAADRHQQHVEVGHRGQHLQRDGALAGDDQAIVIGMDEGQPVCAAMIGGERGGFLEGRAALRSPWRRGGAVFSIFMVGVPSGTKMVAGIASRAA